MKKKRKPFKSLVSGSRRDDFPNLEEATEKAKAKKVAKIFYERGFFGVVWFEDGVRRTRDLKGWSDNEDKILKVDFVHNPNTFFHLKIAS